MTARFGKQRAVIALGLVVVRAGQIDDLRSSEACEQLRPREIVVRRDDFVRRVGVGKIARLVDQDHPTVHDPRPLGHADSRDSVCMMTSGSVPEVRRGSAITGATQFRAYLIPLARARCAAQRSNLLSWEIVPRFVLVDGEQGLLITQGGRPIRIVAGMLAELAKAAALVKRDRRGI